MISLFSMRKNSHKANRGNQKLIEIHLFASEWFGTMRIENYHSSWSQRCRTFATCANSQVTMLLGSTESLRAFWALSVRKRVLVLDIFAHFSMDFSRIFDQIRAIFQISSSTSDGRNSSPRWSWATFEYTGTMYSSRYVDSRPLNLSTKKLGAPNRASKLTEFGHNPRSGHAPPY